MVRSDTEEFLILRVAWLILHKHIFPNLSKKKFDVNREADLYYTTAPAHLMKISNKNILDGEVLLLVLIPRQSTYLLKISLAQFRKDAYRGNSEKIPMRGFWD